MQNPAASKLRTYTPRERNFYLAGMFGQNIMYSIIGIYASYYIRNVLFIPAAIVGVVLVIAEIWDAINDPIMGTIVDRTHTKLGKCRPYLMWAPGLVFLTTMLLFMGAKYEFGANVSMWKNVGVVAWAFGFYLCWDLAYTVGDIPLWGITALMTEDEKHRQKLQALARIVGGFGSGVAILAFQPISVAVGQSMGSERSGFILVALVYSVVGCALFQLVGIFTREKFHPPPTGNSVGMNFKMAWQNKPFRQILVSGVLASPRNLTMLIAFDMVTFYFAGKDPGKILYYIALIGGGLFVGMFTASALTPKLLEYTTKKKLYNTVNLVDVVPNVLIFALYLISLNVRGGLTNVALLIPTMILFAVKGVALGIFSVLQTNMAADAVDYEDYVNHRRPDGVFFSGMTFLAKINTGISTLIYAFLSAIVGFSGLNIEMLQSMADSGSAPRELMRRGSEAVVYHYSNTNYAGGLVTGSLTGGQLFNFFTMMFFAVTIIPAVASVLAVIPTWKYALTPEKLDEILVALQERRRVEGELAEEE